MTFVEIRTLNGVRYALDAFGLIWREQPNAPAGRPHWTRTDITSFERVRVLTANRTRISL